MKRTMPNEFHADSPLVFHFLKEQEEKLHQLHRTRCREILHSALNRLIEFRNGADFPFSMFTGSMMESFEAYLKRRELKRNSIGFYMRALRTYYNIAVCEGIAIDNQPFRNVYKGKDKTVKRALSLQEIKRIKELELSAKPHLAYARDMLMFSFYARGMAFVDMAFLKKSSLQGDHYVYCRRKTGQTLCVEWLKQMQEIVNKYPTNQTPYLLPIITNDNKNDRNQYLLASRRINRNLKIIGRMAKLHCPLSMYCSRHSWATIARSMQIPIGVISEGLGHDNERTTQIYLDSIQTSIIDKANRKILKNLHG